MTSVKAKSLIFLAFLAMEFTHPAQGKPKAKPMKQRVMLFFPGKEANQPVIVSRKNGTTPAMSNATIFAAADRRINGEPASDNLLVPKLPTVVSPSPSAKTIDDHIELPPAESEGQ